MTVKALVNCLAAAALVAIAAVAHAQKLPNPYGMPIGIEDAKKAAGAAIAEARARNWQMAVAIVDPAGDLVYFEKMDGTQNASVAIAIEKARTAALFKRPTRAMQDVLAEGGAGARYLALPNAVPVEGGLPLLIDGKVVGAIGVSGGTSAEDGQAGAKGVAALE